MSIDNNLDTSVLDNLIFGRVEPIIYAFATGMVPNHIKVGDTYRPVDVRLKEWRRYYPDLEKVYQRTAKVNDETFFRDYSVHKYLEQDAKKSRLSKDSLGELNHYSNEFFEAVDAHDINEAIDDIKEAYNQNNQKYLFYKFEESHIPITHSYERIESYEPRPNQQQAIENFKKAIANGRSNLLMYAVMRFGKSFTSMCCAVEINAKSVLILSAKADVKEEWKKTIESHKKFEGFKFYDSYTLLRKGSVIKDTIENNQKLALFLTLQDLQGDDIKLKHQEVFETDFDLLIIDETHFGARAEEYGKVLRNQGLEKRDIDRELKEIDCTFEQIEESKKCVRSKVRLHLSGTPYRILMNSEFSQDDIIAFYQFTDISEDQKKWDEENLDNKELNEWDNPYYGFPQMVRFAFNPNKSSRELINRLKAEGHTSAFSKLFEPESLKKDLKESKHKKFKNEQEVIELFKVIDGSQADEDLLGFLDYDKIKEGKMCRHIVCVLPYRASCDALESLILSNSFKNLNSYKIVNISGVDETSKFNSTSSIKEAIAKYEQLGEKTITLTVNRMLTGSTVPEWDTMIYLKDTASPQEYDQAVFRLQSQYIKTYKSVNGKIIKFNMKPQTLLVDFNPNRMFEIQEEKSLIYNVNSDLKGNEKLKERIEKELTISPIIRINRNKIVQVTPKNIIDEVRNYSKERSVLDEATSIPIDLSLLSIDRIKSLIDSQSKLGSKRGLKINPFEGEGNDLDNNDSNQGDKQKGKDKEKDEANDVERKKSDEKDFKEKFAMYYARILFFAFLSDGVMHSLSEIVKAISSDRINQRIANNLDIDLNDLKLFRENINPFVLNELDYKIQNINSLANDKSIPAEDRASIAIKKFSRLSDSEVITPDKVTDIIIEMIPRNYLALQSKWLDIASKQGEFVYAVFRKFGKEIANNLYSIPTSTIAYEFTRKVYLLLGLNQGNIESTYVSYDLVVKDQVENPTIKINDKHMKFDVVIGNPPYQVMDKGANKNSASPVYNKFMNIAKSLDPSFISMIMPTKWYAGGKGLNSFRDEMLNDIHISELHDFLKPDLIFPKINLRGGICIVVWNKDYDNSTALTKMYTYDDNLQPKLFKRKLKTEGSDILIRHYLALEIINKVSKSKDFKSFENYVSPRRPFGIDGNITNDVKVFNKDKSNFDRPILCYAKGRKEGYIDKSLVNKNHDLIDKYKVFTSYTNNIGTELNDDNLNAFIGVCGTVCTETYILLGFNLDLNEVSANNICTYFKSKFARFMHSLAKASHHGTSKTYKFVPLQNFTPNSDIDWSSPINEIDTQLYQKYKLNSEEIEFIENMIKPMTS